MIALARVDLPDPLGPIRAWIRPFSTSRSSPLRICLSSAFTCRFRISSSAIGLHVVCGWPLDGAAHGLSRGVARAGELDQLGQGGTRKRPRDSALNPGPEELRRAGLVAVALVRAENLALGRFVEALHRRDLALQRLDDLVHRDLRRRPREAVAAVRAAGRGDEAGVAKLRDEVLEVGEREALRLGDGAQRDRLLAGLTTELDHQADPVLGFGREQHRLNPTE